MKDEQITINLEDGFKLKGILNRASKDKLIIFVHGLTGNMNEHQFYNGARFFFKEGYSVFRFNLYGGDEGSRTLLSSSIFTHAKDLNAVIDHLSRYFKDIYLVGHSLGGPSIILARQHTLSKSIILWDPTINGYERLIKYSQRDNNNKNIYILSWGVDYLISEDLVESWKSTDPNMLRLIKRPAKIICAGEGTLHKDWSRNIKLIKTDSEMITIEGAGHSFYENDTEQTLFEETLKWLRKFD